MIASSKAWLSPISSFVHRGGKTKDEKRINYYILRPSTKARRLLQWIAVKVTPLRMENCYKSPLLQRQYVMTATVSGGKFDCSVEKSVDFSVEIYCTEKLHL